MPKKNKQNQFEEYLQSIFIKEEPQTLDDYFTDSFNNWLDTIGIDEIIDYAELWGKQLVLKAYKAKEIPQFKGTLEQLNNLPLCPKN